jgi:hypothetical protein
MRQWILFAALAMFSLGCAVEHGRIAFITTDEKADVSQYDIAMIRGKTDVEGEDVQPIVFVITTDGPPRLDEAVKNALNKGGGNLLVNAVCETSGWYIPLIYGKNTWRVRGIVVTVPLKS